MKNTFGNQLTITLFGESHGSAIGAVLDGLAPGITVDEERIRHQLDLRRPVGSISTPRQEADEFQILSGVFEGKTTGTPLCIVIPNTSQKSSDYKASYGKARPSHADYTGFVKYNGFEDYRGGGHFSGRITAALVAAAAIILPALEQKGIYIGTHLQSCAGVTDRAFADINEDIAKLNQSLFPVLQEDAAAAMRAEIEKAAADGDSIGGVLETAVIGLPAGLGEPWFDSMESLLAHGIFAVPAVKGVSFGKGFALSSLRGSEANGSLRYEDGKVVDEANTNGGILGGITNGMPVLINTAIKPTPSIFKQQQTIDFIKEENAELELKGRHDPCIAHRARVVIDSICALTVADVLTGRFGTDYLTMAK